MNAASVTPKAHQIATQHREAMALAERALRTQDPRLARTLFRKAFESERHAAKLLENCYEQEPTRSVLYRSAASLALDCGEALEAQRLVEQGLKGRPPADIAEELQEIFDRARSLQAEQPARRSGMTVASLRKLYVEQLKDLYSAEKQILQALPRMALKTSNPQLKSLFEQHLRQTEEQVLRLDRIFEGLGKHRRGKKNKSMEGLIEEAREILMEDMDDEIRDAALIAAAQKIEHYEIAGYGTVRTYAELLGENEAVKFLQRTLDEEGRTDKELAALVESSIYLEVWTDSEEEVEA